MPFLVKQHVTAQNINGDTFTHMKGSVLSDWELSDFIREKIAEGSEWYRERFESLLEHEAHSYRVKATEAEGSRFVNGEEIPPPWDDYVGLHPTEILGRLREADLAKVRQVKLFEQGGMLRSTIIDFVSPAEREPFSGYDQMSVGEILEKFAVISDPAVSDALAYEKAHKNRPAIVEYEREIYEHQQPAAV